jgi:hypothetical protein
MEQTECFETSAYKFQTMGNCPKESIQHVEQGESLKSNMPVYFAQKDSEFQEYLFMILEPFYTQLPWARHCGVRV